MINMNLFLNQHRKDYSLDLLDVGYSLITSLSGFSYAKRHFELANLERSNSLAHKIIGTIEFIPVIGGIAALVERIACYVATSFFNISYTPPRRYPPRSSICDTGVLNSLGNATNAHHDALVFLDREIITVHGVKRKKNLSTWFDPVYAEYTESNKAIIQQQAIKGCTAAAVAMLIVDNGKNCDIHNLRSTNLGNGDTMESAIIKAGLTPVTSSVDGILELKHAIESKGSAIVSIANTYPDDVPKSELFLPGGHVIVVDAIYDHGVRLRDPYHGWEITVTLQSFIEKIGMGNGRDIGGIMQIEKNNHQFPVF